MAKIKIYTYHEIYDKKSHCTIYHVFVNGKNAGFTHNERDIEGMTKIIPITKKAGKICINLP